MNVQAIQQLLREFAEQRDWQQFHSPKNLAMALSGEAGELLEILQWLTPEQSESDELSPDQIQAIQEELADILIYALRMSDRLGIDIEEAVSEKMKVNADKYPVALAKGNAVKYNKRKD